MYVLIWGWRTWGWPTQRDKPLCDVDSIGGGSVPCTNKSSGLAPVLSLETATFFFISRGALSWEVLADAIPPVLFVDSAEFAPHCFAEEANAPPEMTRTKRRHFVWNCLWHCFPPVLYFIGTNRPN